MATKELLPTTIHHQESKKKIRETLCLAIVISGMYFNGVIYGFTSPALPSFYSVEDKTKDSFLPKYELFLHRKQCIYSS